MILTGHGFYLAMLASFSVSQVRFYNAACRPVMPFIGRAAAKLTQDLSPSLLTQVIITAYSAPFTSTKGHWCVFHCWY
ncbi:hypothetical protein EDB85DRAFT_1928140 [Lactarius pseudohatsudake]|nr:hypothetical protein EDB85DRAFT_1928140 [Lactarius pseudohatsudake]